jgi:hypothetical protein
MRVSLICVNGLAPGWLTFTLDVAVWQTLGAKQQKEHKMDKALRILAFVANALMIIAVFVIWQESRPRGVQVLLIGLMFLPPLLSLIALWQGPDCEERRLRRQLNKAELKQRLKELSQG